MLKNILFILIFIGLPMGLSAQVNQDTINVHNEILIYLDSIEVYDYDEGTNNPLLNGYIYAGGLGGNVYYKKNDRIEVFYLKKED